MNNFGDCEMCFWALEINNYDVKCLHPSVGGKIVRPPDGCDKYECAWKDDNAKIEVI